MSERGLLARWLYEGGPQRTLKRITRCPRWVGIGLATVAALTGVFVLRPKPLEERLGLPPQVVRECVVAISEVPTEYAARMGYKECLHAKREQIDYAYRLPLWREYNRQVAEVNRCKQKPEEQGARNFDLPPCPPEPTKPPLYAPR